ERRSAAKWLTCRSGASCRRPQAADRRLRRIPLEALIADACMLLTQRFPHAVGGRHHAFSDDELAAHEDERARAAQDAAARLDELADLHRVDEVYVEVH